MYLLQQKLLKQFLLMMEKNHFEYGVLKFYFAMPTF